MSVRERIKKVAARVKPSPPIILIEEGQELTAEQQQKIERSRAAGMEPEYLKIEWV